MTSTVQKRVLNNYSIGLLGFGVTLLQTIISVPILLNYWGNDLYGIWIALFAGFSLLQTFDFGHQSYIGNLLNVEYHLNKEKFSEYLGSSLIIALILGIFQLLISIFLIITGYLSSFLGIAVSETNYFVISTSLLSLMLMWVIAGSVGGIIIKILIPAGYLAQSLIWGSIFKLGQFLSLVLVAILGGKILEASLVYSTVQFLLSFAAFRYIRNKVPEYYPWWKAKNLLTGFQNLKKSTVLTINNALQQLSNNGIVLFITNVFSTALVPAFTTVRTLTNTATVFTNLFITSIQPDLIKYHAKLEIDKLNSTLNANWFFSGLVVNTGLILVIPFADSIFRIWTKGLVTFDFKLFIALAASISMINFGAGLFNYLYGINHLVSISIITFTRAVVLFIFSLILASTYGLAGIGLAVLLSELVASLLLPIILVKKLLKTLNVTFANNNLSLAIAAPFIISVLALLKLVGLEFNLFIYLLSISLIVGVYIVNWFILETEIKDRLLDLMRHSITRKK